MARGQKLRRHLKSYIIMHHSPNSNRFRLNKHLSIHDRRLVAVRIVCVVYTPKVFLLLLLLFVSDTPAEIVLVKDPRIDGKLIRGEHRTRFVIMNKYIILLFQDIYLSYGSI